MKTTALNSVLCLSILAGAAPAVAQMTPVERRATNMSEQRTLSFLEADDLLGTPVHNANGAEIGSVDDFVIERGTGRISHVVIDHGGIFGFFGERVALPMEIVNLRRTSPHVRVLAAVTPESLEHTLRMSADDWVDIDEADQDWMKYIEAGRVAHDAKHAKNDPYTGVIKSGKPSQLHGTITDVDRIETEDGVELVALTVDPDDGPARRVVIGPSWYVMNQPAAPMRGSTIKLTAYELPRSEDHHFVAASYTMNGDKAMLRDSDGAPRWQTNRYNPDHGSDLDGARSMALLTNVIGADADARWDDAGSIEGAVIELNSARVAMVTLDPDENFLGIGDTLRCVPWSVIGHIGSDSVTIDADKDMLTSSPFTPSDITILTRSAQLEPVYAAYGVQPVAFKPNTADKSKTMSRSVPAKFIDACKKGDAFSFTGAVREVSTREYDGFSTPMYTARVHTSNGTKTVLLGPAWFVKQRSWTLSEGDEITIDGKTASFDGETYHVAQKVHLPSGDGVAHLWNNNAPRWSMN